MVPNSICDLVHDGERWSFRFLARFIHDTLTASPMDGHFTERM